MRVVRRPPGGSGCGRAVELAVCTGCPEQPKEEPPAEASSFDPEEAEVRGRLALRSRSNPLSLDAEARRGLDTELEAFRFCPGI